MTRQPPVRVGIVGLGTVGRIHAERLARLDADLVAGADLDGTARDSFAEEFDAETYADHETMLESADVDAVIAAVPNRYHEPVAVDALAADRDVLVEKPLAHSLESAERIAAAAADSAGNCMVGFTMRFSALTRRAVELREAGRLGSLSHVDVTYCRRDNLPGDGHSWFTDPELAGGGVTMDLGVHVVDLALHVLDYPGVLEVSAATRSEFGAYDVDDSATALIRCEGGRTVSVQTAWRSTRPSDRSCSVRGTDGGVAFSVTEPDLEFVSAPPDGETETIPVESGDMYLTENRAFVDAVAGDSSAFEGTLSDALVVQRVLHAIAESSERNEAVTLADVH